MEVFDKYKPRRIIGFLFIGLLLYIIFSSISLSDHVFEGPTQQEFVTDRQSYYVERRARNARAMKVSYEHLMEIGQHSKINEDWLNAIAAFTQAKSIYPTAINPRLELCYLFVNQCRVDGSYCKLGQREIYYALQHVDQNDRPSLAYLDQLVAHARIEDIVTLDENEAMKAIF